MDHKEEPGSQAKDVATQTSHEDILESTSGSRDTLRGFRTFSNLNYRNAATETDFPAITSLTNSLNSTNMDDDDYSRRSSVEAVTLRRDPLPHAVKPRFMVTSSSSSSELLSDKQQRQFALKASKSQHVKKHQFSSEEDLAAEADSNLQKGHVFVYMVIPPDGGYGWFIMLISFLCQMVVDGIIFGIGVLLPHIAQEFNVPGSKVVLVASMQVGFYFLAGTVSSAFINKYGFRPVALAGCLLSICVLTIATYSTSLSMMILFYSVLGGPGLSMIWVASQLIIGYYFEKYRPIANGLSCAGAGLGIMLFAYMNNVLVGQVGWRNLMRIHVGFLAFVLLMGLTYVEVAPTRIGRVKESIIEDSDTDSGDLIADLTRYSRYSIKVHDQLYSLNQDFQSVMHQLDQPKPTADCLSFAASCCTCCKRAAQAQDTATTKRYIIRQDLMEKLDLFYTGPMESHDETSPSERRKTVAFAEGEHRRTISLDTFDRRINQRSVVTTLASLNTDLQAQDQRKSYRELKETKRCPVLAYLRPGNILHPKIRNGFRLLFDFRLLAIREFRVLLASAFLFPMGFNIPFVYSTGFVAFKFREHTTYICGGGMVFGGMAVCASAFYGLDVVWFQFLYATCYGIAPAFYSTLRAIIYVRSLGLDKLTNAFGLTALAMGMGVFIGTTAGGILNDLTGDYTASFAFAGLCIIVAGVLKLLLPYLTAAEIGRQK